MCVYINCMRGEFWAVVYDHIILHQKWWCFRDEMFLVWCCGSTAAFYFQLQIASRLDHDSSWWWWWVEESRSLHLVILLNMDQFIHETADYCRSEERSGSRVVRREHLSRNKQQYTAESFGESFCIMISSDFFLSLLLLPRHSHY